MGERTKDPSAPPDFATTIEASVRLPSARHGTRYEPGDRVADATIESFIAEGGFGSVYRATHDRLGSIALKISHIPATYLSTDALALQQNELEALMQLRHPSLVRVLGHGVLDDRRYYLALELVAGESLRRYMERRGRVDVLEALPLTRRIAEAIAHCHQVNTFHLDLTPTNVIVVDDSVPEIKVVDFGVAAFAQHWFDIERRPAAGTPRYIAPELLADAPQIGGHCDVYALGLILYELLAGCFPYAGSTAQELLHKKLVGEAAPVTAHAPDVPGEVAATVHALIHPDPAQRGFSAASLGQHLKELYFEILRRDRAHGRDRPRPRHKSGERDAQAPFVGRDEELRGLVARAEAVLRAAGPAAAGAPAAGWAVVISGDPGIGKSRILAELTHWLQSQGVVIGYGRCREHGNLVSYASWRECLGQIERTISKSVHPAGEAARAAITGLLADPGADDLCVMVPALERARIGAGAAPAQVSVPDVGSKRVSQAVKRLLTAIAAHLPAALVLEDLHWADQGTLDILGALVLSPLPPGLLILCTARPEAGLPVWPAVDYLRLRPLDERQSAELLRALSGAASPEVIAELTAAIPLLRLGNPLVDTQVILHLKREGLLAEDGGGRMILTERFGRDYEPPTTIASVLERRLQHVPARARDILGVASLIGRQFHISDLKRIAGAEIGAEIDAGDVDEAVRQAVDLSLGRADGDECTFVHDVIRDHLESTVAAARRPALHARIAEALRARGAPAATRADHLDRGGDRAAAAAKYFDGGMEADRVHDLVGSSRSLRRAVALYLELAASPDRDRALARSAYELARITCLLGKTHQPLEDLDRCHAAMTAPPDDARVMLHSAYARVYYAQGDFLQAMDHSEQSLAVADPALDHYQCVPANMLGRALCASGHFGPSIDLLLRGCQLARDANDLVELAHSEGLLGTSLAFVGELEAGRQHIAESSRLAELLRNPARRMGVCLYQTLHAEAAYRWEEGIRTSAQLLAHAEEYEMAGLYLYLGTLMAGRHHFHIGEPQRARHLLRNSINFSTLFGIRISRSWAHAYLGDVCLVEGQHEEALRLYEAGLEIAREGRGDGFGLPLSLIGMAHAAACLGRDRARVSELAEQAFEAFEAASNITALAVGLVRYRDALARYEGTGALGEVARARLARVLARVGAPRCEFWPVLPASATDAERALAPADYWRRRTERTPSASDRAGKSDAAAGALLFNLSTIDDFVPAFAARALP
jgi:tetratricopeptide (TPR) repeat protein